MNVILQPPNDDAIKAVVIMYGWLGSIEKHLKKYADLYTNHLLQKCAVVYGTASTSTLIFRHDEELAAMAMDSVRKAAAIIRQIESSSSTKAIVPVVLHYFSNGGAFVAEKLGQMIQDAISAGGQISTKKNKHDKGDADDLKLIHERLNKKGFEVLDSSPAYLYESTYFRCIDMAVPSLPLRIIFKGFISLSTVYKKIMACANQQERVDVIFWQNMMESELCQRQAFVYSTADVLTDSHKLDEFINERQKRGIQVIVQKFDDSGHVLHLKEHPEEYKGNIVDYVLKTVCQQHQA